jgi:hypothetical protein
VSFEWVGSRQIGASPREARGHLSAFAVAAALIITALVTILPAALGPVRLNDSYWIDLVWLEQFARELSQGTLYPRWLPLSHGGLGSPVFYYYPPTAFYLASLFALTGIGTYVALVAAFGAANLISGAGVYLWLKGQCERPLPWALLFMVAPYHLFNFYLRGALAEFVATAALPFVMLGIRQIALGRPRAFACTAVAYAVLVMSHLPLALLASVFLFLPYTLANAWRSPAKLSRVAAALGMGILAAAIYLVPAIALEPYRSSADLWALPYLQPANWTIWSVKSLHVATFRAMLMVSGAIALATATVLARCRSAWGVWALALTALAIGVVPFIWLVPPLNTVQFPFRILPVAEFSLITAAALAPRKQIPLGLLSMLFVAFAVLTVTAQTESSPFGESALRAHHPDVPENLPPGERPYSWPSKWALQLATEHRQPQFDGKVTVEPVFYFPAWKVSCAGTAVPTFPAPHTVLLAHQGSGCSRSLVWTSAEKTGAAISLAALLLLLSSLISPALLARHRSRRRESHPRNT